MKPLTTLIASLLIGSMALTAQTSFSLNAGTGGVNVSVNHGLPSYAYPIYYDGPAHVYYGPPTYYHHHHKPKYHKSYSKYQKERRKAYKKARKEDYKAYKKYEKERRKAYKKAYKHGGKPQYRKGDKPRYHRH